MLLNIMSGIDTFGDHPINVARIHHEIEAGRLAYRDRNLYLADPTFSEERRLEAMLSDEICALIRGQINPNRALDDLPESSLPPHKSTVHISVVDKDRNACSFINTVFHNFGAGILAPKSGVVLQNRGPRLCGQARASELYRCRGSTLHNYYSAWQPKMVKPSCHLGLWAVNIRLLAICSS